MNLDDWLNLSTAAFTNALHGRPLDTPTADRIRALIAANAVKTLDTEWERVSGGDWTNDATT